MFPYFPTSHIIIFSHADNVVYKYYIKGKKKVTFLLFGSIAKEGRRAYCFKNFYDVK